MRRTISILLTALVAFGCAKEELAVLEPSGTTEASGSVGMSPINFAFSKGAENLGTKAASIDDVLPEGATLNVFADVYLTPAGGTKTLYVQNYLNGVKYDNDGNPVSGKYYWPESDDNVALDFYFVYPYKEGRTISNKSFEYTIDSDPSKQEDLLVASSLNTAFPSSTGGRVSVAMDHALSLLAFKVKTKSGSYKVESITVNNTDGFYDTGVYTFGSGWGSRSKANSVKSISSPIKVADVSSSDYTDVNNGDYCFLLPQSVASMGIEVSYSVVKGGTKYTKTKSGTLSSNTFVAGEKYTYKISLDPITAKLATPTNLKASETGTDNITFTWDAVENADYYILTNEVTGARLTSNCTATSYTWSGLSSGTTYTIGVVAVSTDAFYENSGKATAEAKTKSGSGTVGWDSGTVSGRNWYLVPTTGLNGASLENALKEADGKTGSKIKISYSNPKGGKIRIESGWSNPITENVDLEIGDHTIEFTFNEGDLANLWQYSNHGNFKGMVVNAQNYSGNDIVITQIQIIIPN